MVKNEYIDGAVVSYETFLSAAAGKVLGLGKIRGIAPRTGGRYYIIEDISGNFPSKEYPFKFFTCSECRLSDGKQYEESD